MSSFYRTHKHKTNIYRYSLVYKSYYIYYYYIYSIMFLRNINLNNINASFELDIIYDNIYNRLRKIILILYEMNIYQMNE